MNIKGLIKTKTFWTAVSGVVAAIGGMITGTIDIGMTIQTIFGALVAICLRDGMVKE